MFLFRNKNAGESPLFCLNAIGRREIGMRDANEVADELLREFSRGFSVTEHRLPRGVQLTTDRGRALWLCDLGWPPAECAVSEPAIGEIWTNTLQNVCGDLGCRLLNAGINREIAEQLAQKLFDCWEGQLKSIGMWDFIDTLWQYARIIVYHRMLEEGPDGLGEWLFRVLRAGGLPCGCEGKWPEKPLVVYWPHKAEPMYE